MKKDRKEVYTLLSIATFCCLVGLFAVNSVSVASNSMIVRRAVAWGLRTEDVQTIRCKDIDRLSVVRRDRNIGGLTPTAYDLIGNIAGSELSFPAGVFEAYNQEKVVRSRDAMWNAISAGHEYIRRGFPFRPFGYAGVLFLAVAVCSFFARGNLLKVTPLSSRDTPV